MTAPRPNKPAPRPKRTVEKQLKDAKAGLALYRSEVFAFMERLNIEIRVMRELKDSLGNYRDRLDEQVLRLDSNRTATLQCILGQQRVEEELRKLRALYAEALIDKVRELAPKAPKAK